MTREKPSDYRIRLPNCWRPHCRCSRGIRTATRRMPPFERPSMSMGDPHGEGRASGSCERMDHSPNHLGPHPRSSVAIWPGRSSPLPDLGQEDPETKRQVGGQHGESDPKVIDELQKRDVQDDPSHMGRKHSCGLRRRWFTKQDVLCVKNEFDAVVVTSGHYHTPRLPTIPGLRTWPQAYPDR